jgi:hypothetical protein
VNEKLAESKIQGVPHLVIVCVECGFPKEVPFSEITWGKDGDLSHYLMRNGGWVLSLVSPQSAARPRIEDVLKSTKAVFAPVCASCAKKTTPPDVLACAKKKLS